MRTIEELIAIAEECETLPGCNNDAKYDFLLERLAAKGGRVFGGGIDACHISGCVLR